MNSLRRRLLGRLLTLFLFTWAFLAALSYLAARHEIEELFDAELARSARVLLELARHELIEEQARDALAPGTIGAGAHPYEEKIAFQIWKGEALLLRSANAPREPLATSEEFVDQQIGDREWRVFSLLDAGPGIWVSVGELDEVRNELIRDILATSLLPVLLVLPLLALVVWSAVGTGLAPLRQVGDEIARRTPSQLDALATAAVPVEVRPLVEALNGLLARLAEALESERRFTANAAHELRTPLAALKTQAQVAQRAATDAERQHALEQVVRGVDRAARLIEQMLTLARLDPQAPPAREARADLTAVAAQVLSELAPGALERGVDLALDDAPAAPVRGDADLLAVLLRNLIDNAVRYTPRGGQVVVAVHADAEAVEVAVCDTGPGVPAEERERVFERFYRIGASRASGSGLGLSIARRIADLHGAAIRLNDAPGGGLCVRVGFPAVTASP